MPLMIKPLGSLEDLKSKKPSMLKAIDDYLEHHPEKDIGRTRALHLQAALKEIDIDQLTLMDAQRKLYELVYLLLQTSSSDLKNRILLAFDRPEYDFRDRIENEEHLFGDIATLALDSHRLLFEKDLENFDEEPSPVAQLFNSINQAFPEEEITVERLNQAINNYQLHDDLSHARVRNLKTEIEAIQNSNESAQEKMKKCITLACAVVFKSGSRNLARSILAKTVGIDGTLTLKHKQQTHEISDYAVLQKAREINTLTKISDWTKLRDDIKHAVENYRQSGLGGLDGNFRAELLLHWLIWLSQKNMAEYCNQYHLIQLVYAIAIASGSIQLKTAILDFAGLSEKDWENLKNQYAISHQAIERVAILLNSRITRNPNAAPAAESAPVHPSLQNLYDQFFIDLKNNLILASKKYLSDGLGGAAGRNRARNLKTALAHISDPTSELGKKQVILLASAIITGPASKSIHANGSSTKMAAKAMIYTGFSENLIQLLQKDFEIPAEVRDRLANRSQTSGELSATESKKHEHNDDTLSDADSTRALSSSSRPILQDNDERSHSLLHAGLQWEQVKTKLSQAIEQYTPDQINRLGVARKQYLNEKLKTLSNIGADVKEQRELALLLTTIELIESITLKNLIFQVLAPPDGKEWKAIVDTLRDEFLIFDLEREGIKNTLNGLLTTTARAEIGLFSAHGGGLHAAYAASLSSAGAAAAASAAALYFCPIEAGWEEFKSDLAEIANGVLADDTKNDTQKTVAGNLILELEKAKDVSQSKIQKFLLNLAGVVFLDDNLGLKNGCAQIVSKEKVRQSINDALITESDLSAMIKKLKKPMLQKQGVRRALESDESAITGMSEELPKLSLPSH